MRRENDSGFVLAGVLAALLAMSVVASALVVTASASQRRLVHAQADLADELALRSAITFAAAQIALDPARRDMKLENGRHTRLIDDRHIEITVSYEALRLDIARAELEPIEQALEQNGAATQIRSRIIEAVRRHRLQERPVVLLDDLDLPPALLACLSAVATPFGGQTLFQADRLARMSPQQAGPGETIRISASLNERPTRHRAVMLYTGRRERPFDVLDYQRLASTREDCHA